MTNKHIEIVDWDDAPVALNHYPAGISVTGGKMIFLSGVTAAPAYHTHPHIPEEFDQMPQDMEGQTRAALEKVKKSLESVGGSMSDVVDTVWFLRDMTTQSEMRKVRKEFFGEHRPSSTTVQIVRTATDPRCLIEIKVVAVVDA